MSGATSKPVVSIRLDPRLRYLAEIAARQQRRSLSAYVAWALEKHIEAEAYEVAAEQTSDRYRDRLAEKQKEK